MFVPLSQIIASVDESDVFSSYKSVWEDRASFEDEVAFTDMQDEARSVKEINVDLHLLSDTTKILYFMPHMRYMLNVKRNTENVDISDLLKSSPSDLQFVYVNELRERIPQALATKRIDPSDTNMYEISQVCSEHLPGTPLLMTKYEDMLRFLLWVPNDIALDESKKQIFYHRVACLVMGNVLMFGTTLESSEEAKDSVVQNISDKMQQVGVAPRNIDDLLQKVSMSKKDCFNEHDIRDIIDQRNVKLMVWEHLLNEYEETTKEILGQTENEKCSAAN